MSILINESNQSKYKKYMFLSKMDINIIHKATLYKLTLKRPVLGTATAGFLPPRGKFFSFEAIPILILERILRNTALTDELCMYLLTCII
jgi:hypothetical protein